MHRRVVMVGLVLALAVVVVMAAQSLDWRHLGPRHVLLLAAAGIGFCAVAMLADSIWRVHARLERLRGHVALAASNIPLPPIDADRPDGIDRLHLAIADLLGRGRAAQSGRDRRLEQILGALPDPVIVITAEGLVSLINAAGRALFDGRSLVPGTSIYDLLPPAGLETAMTQSRVQGMAIDCRLETLFGDALGASVSAFADAGGAVIRFTLGQGPLGHLEHDLALHDRPPAAPRVTAETPLAELPALALDTETTGLNPGRDRVVSLGAVRLHGPRLYRSEILDLLINPGRQIPAVATAVHGISDAMVLPAPSYGEVAPQIMAALKDVAVIGHHTAFDLAVLRRASVAVGIDWQDPPWLDTALLYSALEPEARHFDLDFVAQAYGVAIHGRHTALGDAVAAAELFIRFLPMLEAHGIATLGQAMAFQMTGRRGAKRHHLEGSLP
jgi:DNA polymerase-3 subunit epsilon